jgi:DNA-binding GntR family transcriptional regulator
MGVYARHLRREVLITPAHLGAADPRAYVRLAAMVREQITDGTLGPGLPVPSITRLSQEYGHARPTCGKALRLLESEGLLTRIPGLGYYVNPELTPAGAGQPDGWPEPGAI